MRIAMISMHTSPLANPGRGDAGGMNVYVDSVARRLARRGCDVDVFTLAEPGHPGDLRRVAPGYRVHRLAVERPRGIAKEDLPGMVCEFGGQMLSGVAAQHRRFDVVHSHYWLSGQVGLVAAAQWGVPHVHAMHTAARVKNLYRAAAEAPEPQIRIAGEDRVVARADRLVANTADEAAHLARLYGADPSAIDVVHPGVDLGLFRPRDKGTVRDVVGVDRGDVLVFFAGRIQPLKAPDLVIRSVAALVEQRPHLRRRLTVALSGGTSGRGPLGPQHLRDLAAALGIADRLVIEEPRDRERLAAWFAAADVTLVPSYNETFGLVAIESQASGTPVLAANVGGLRTAVADGRSGMLIDGHGVGTWAGALGALVEDPVRLAAMTGEARRHAERFSWGRTTDGLLAAYRRAVAAPDLALAAPA